MAKKTLDTPTGKQQVLTRKKVAKIKPGTWIEVAFTDAPNRMMLMLDAHKGYLHCYDPHEKESHYHTSTDQIVASHGECCSPMRIPSTTKTIRWKDVEEGEQRENSKLMKPIIYTENNHAKSTTQNG